MNNVILSAPHRHPKRTSEGSLGSNKIATLITRNDTKRNMNKKFKALMIDCDGTLVEYLKEALPSQKVTRAVNEASKILHVGLATSRGYEETFKIAEHLDLNGPSILHGGALIMDFKKKEILWEKVIPQNIAKQIAEIFSKYQSGLFVNDFLGDVLVSKEKLPQKSYNMFSAAQTEETAKKILKELSEIPGISATYVPSWTAGKFDVLVYQSLATKQHGIFEVAKLLKLDPKDFIVIGDGYNDFPLLEAAGFGVAMGNASEELKAIADYVAPTVYEDGVADVIEKFIL